MKSREMTVYRARGNGKDLTLPMIMMQGKWLRDMGFAVGDRVSVTLQDGKLVVERTGRVWSDPKAIAAVKEEAGISDGKAV